ncbi:MAG: alpha/beta hydrolase [Burkholderiaceae bacterium]|nr:alpha/beta hydrolase [Burkholderiaceae bacterium]
MLNRTTLAKAVAAITLVASAGAYAGQDQTSTAPIPTHTTSVVLVHGAFADGSDWAKVIPLLQAKGIKVRSVQNSLDSLAGDVAAAKRAINDQPGKVVLVGHSWGGMVITEAGVNDKVAGLVYVAAFAPEAGQNALEVGKDFPPSPGIQKLAPDSEGYLYLPAEAVATDFAQDVSAKQAAVMAATQGPINSKAFGDKTTVAAWSSKPSWYIVSEKDRMIAPDLERALAKKIGAKVTTLPTSHVPQQSRPADVAKVIIAAVEASEK